MMESKVKQMTHNEIFAILSKVEYKDFIEQKGKLSYVSWANNIKAVLKQSDLVLERMEIVKRDGKSWIYDEQLGYAVECSVTINGHTINWELPIMDERNDSMKDKPWSYKSSEWKGGNKVEVMRTVEAATMTDINYGHMRCFAKIFAIFGLGLDVYIKDGGADKDPGREKAPDKPKPVLYTGEQKTKAEAYLKEKGVKISIDKADPNIKIVWNGDNEKLVLDEKELSYVKSAIAGLGYKLLKKKDEPKHIFD